MSLPASRTNADVNGLVEQLQALQERADGIVKQQQDLKQQLETAVAKARELRQAVVETQRDLGGEG
jgi:uncharacterized coiled-coil DUF342 family protein